MDTLLELPEDIIYYIVFMLKPTNKDAIWLSLVSKKFSYILQKRDRLALEPMLNDSSVSNAIYQKIYREELNYMVSTLKRYQDQSIPLLDFIFFHDSEYHASSSDKDAYEQCIELATKKDLKYICLMMPLEICYVVAQPVFELKSLELLQLSGCKLQSERIVWRNLKYVYMWSVDFDEVVFENLIRSCPFIENLNISGCYENIPDFKFKVANILNLKQLQIIGFPNQALELMNAYQNLEELVLDVAIIDDNLFTNFEQAFPLLEYLSIGNNENLRRINISSTSLKEIHLNTNQALHQIYFNLPNIVNFVFCSDTNIPKLSFLGNPSGWVSSIKFIEWEDSIEASWFLELNHLLAALSGSKISFVVHFTNKPYFNEGDGIAEDSVSFLGIIEGIHDFYIETSWPKFSMDVAKVVLDDIHWICRPKIIIFRHWCDFPDDQLYQMVWRSDIEKDPQFQQYNVELITKTAQPTLKFDKLLKLLKAHQKKDRFIVSFNMEYLKIQHDSYSLWSFFPLCVLCMFFCAVINFTTR